MPLVGGIGDVHEPDENVHNITTQVKNEVQSQSGHIFEEFVPLQYKTQLVNGKNYFIKVRGGPNKHLHLRIYQSFQGEVKLSAFQLEKTLEDELVYFQ